LAATNQGRAFRIEAAFARFYRDNTMQSDFDILRRDMHHGTAEVHAADHPDSLCRLDAVMMQAAIVSPSGALARHARVAVKQGICHHFANEGTLSRKSTSPRARHAPGGWKSN
jgi:hypothetical protein